MAKKSVVAREVKRQKLHDRHAAKRAELKKQRAEAVGNPDRLAEIQREFQKLPLNSSPSRLHSVSRASSSGSLQTRATSLASANLLGKGASWRNCWVIQDPHL